MNKTLIRWLACGAFAAGPAALAAEPAATLLPVRAVDPPAAAVVRGAAPPPAPQFQAPASVPAPGARPQNPVAQPTQQPSGWGVPKSMFGGTPVPPTQAKPWWPTGADSHASVPPPKPPSGVYASPPAYRWYGYGTPTAGANPYAPTGRYPQASDTWFAQTGATPGAFPVPVGGQPVIPRESPVVVQAFPQEPPRPVDMTRSQVTYRSVPEMPDSVPPRAVVAETPRAAERREPAMPTGPSMLAEPTAPDVNWQPASATSRVPIASTTEPSAATPNKLPVSVPPGEPNAPATDWGPSHRSPPPAGPLPTVTITRGQAPADPPVAPRTDAEVDATVRSASFGRASRVGVTRPGPQRLHVTLVVPTEGDARDAAAVISRLPELKTYSVTFEAVIGK